LVLGIDVAITIIVSTVLTAVITYFSSAWTIKRVSKDITHSSALIMEKVSNDIAHKFIALGYAQSKATREGRVLSLEDMREGLDFADKIVSK
jgi:hypothetical protein